MIQCHFCKFIEEKLVMVVLFICFSVLISVLSILFTALFFSCSISCHCFILVSVGITHTTMITLKFVGAIKPYMRFHISRKTQPSGCR